MSRRSLSLGISLLFNVLPVAAHHSYSMFDQSRKVALQGTVKEVQWTNPHCFLQVIVPASGTATEWSIEMLSPQAMYRDGWRPTTFKPGDKVIVIINPLRNGGTGGYIVSATDASGTVWVPTGKRS
jgi:hypothetical protein